MRVLIAVLILLLTVSFAFSQEVLYSEDFDGGSLNVEWFTPWAEGDLLVPTFVNDNPSGDNWVGSLGNTGSGGGVGTALGGEITMVDYSMEANIFCTVGTGAYHGIVARFDTTGTNSYYYMRADFDADQRLQLREYPGTSGMGSDILSWVGDDIPGGVPTEDGWHNMKIELEGNMITAWWDGVQLDGTPVENNSSTNGAFGIYIFNFSGAAETLCDDIIVEGEAGPQPFDLITVDNDFVDENMEITYDRAIVGQSRYFNLNYQALNGEETSPAFTVTLDIDGSNYETFSDITVEPNSDGSLLTGSSWTATEGEHTLLWTVDSGNTVEESNEDNNTLEVPFLVLPEGAFDLVVDSAWIALAADTSWVPSEVLSQGDDVIFVLEWSAPEGEGFSDILDVTFSLDGEEEYRASWPGVAGGATNTTYSNTWTVSGMGPHYYNWEVDAENTVDEIREYNNSYFNGFMVDDSSIRGTALVEVPEKLEILSAYPNPFNPTTNISFLSPGNESLKLTVYDILGRQIAVLAEGAFQPGKYDVTWNAVNHAAGVYFVVLQCQGNSTVQKITLLK